MTRVRSMSDPGEVLEERHAETMAFLGVELRAHDIAALNHAAEAAAVIGFSQAVLGVHAFDAIAVHEVEAGIVGKVIEQRAGLLRVDEIPAHVRHFQVRLRELEQPAAGRDEIQSGQLPFVASGAQQLHAEADAQHGGAPFQRLLLDRGDELAGGELAHGVVKRADSGQQDLLGLQHLLRRRDQLRWHADLAEHVQDRAEIAHSIIDD